MARKKLKIVGGIVATVISAGLLYAGFDSFIDVVNGTQNLGDAVSMVRTHAANTTQVSLDSLKEIVGQAQEHLTGRWSLFSYSAKELAGVTSQLETGILGDTTQMIGTMKKLKSSYTGPGNCPIVKLIIPGAMVVTSAYYSFSRIFGRR